MPHLSNQNVAKGDSPASETSSLSVHDLERRLREIVSQENRALLAEYAELKPLLKMKDVADSLSVSIRTAEALLADGTLPPPLWIGGQRRWHADTIAAFVRAAE